MAAQSLSLGKHTAWGTTQAVGNALKKPGAATALPTNQRVNTQWQTALTSRAPPTNGATYASGKATPQKPANQALFNAASAARVPTANGLFTMNPNAAQLGSSARNSNVEPFGAQGQFWGMFGPDGPSGMTQQRIADVIAQNAARTTTTSGSQGGGATSFTMGSTMGGNAQLPGMGGASFGGMQMGGGFGGQYMGELGDMLAGGGAAPPPAAPPKPKPEPGTGPGWVDPRDPLTFNGGGYPADDTTHGNALIQQMLASNPRMPQRGDPSGKPGPKPPVAPKPKPGWGGHGGGHRGGPWWR